MKWLNQAEKFVKAWAETIEEITGRKILKIEKESSGTDVIARVHFLMEDGNKRVISLLLNEQENYWGIRGMALDFTSFFDAYCLKEPFYLYSFYKFEREILSFRLVERCGVYPYILEIITRMPQTWEEAVGKWVLHISREGDENDTETEVDGCELFKTIADIALLAYLARRENNE